MKHIILGDVHLGKGISIGKPGSGKDLNSRLQDQLNLLDHVLDIAKTHGFGHIILTGDIFQDSRPHPAIINMFMSWTKKCERQNVVLNIIAGNHDIMRTGSYTISALDLVTTMELPHSFVKDPTIIDFDNVQFTLVPFRDKRMFGASNSRAAVQMVMDEIYLKAKPSKTKPNVMVGHLSLEGCLEVGDEIADSLNEIFIPTEALKDYDHVWMGHIHHPQVINMVQPYAAHVGSMDRSDFGVHETERDKIIIIYDDENNTFVQKVLPTRNLRQLDIEVPPSKDSTDFVINTIAVIDSKKPLKDAIVRLDVQLLGQDLLNIDRAKVEEYIYNKLNAHYICKISESRVLSPIHQEFDSLLNTSTDVRTSIKRFASKKIAFESNKENTDYNTVVQECCDEMDIK